MELEVVLAGEREWGLLAEGKGCGLMWAWWPREKVKERKRETGVDGLGGQGDA